MEGEHPQRLNRNNMAFFEFGALHGLAVSPDTAGRVQDKFRGAEMKRQATLDAANKVRILGDKVKFGKAKNRFDNPILKKYSEDKIKEIGELFTKGDPFSDPGLWIQFNQKTNDLVDNPVVWRAERFEAEAAAMDAWVADPKNGEYRDGKYIQEMQAQRANYLATGDSLGKAGAGNEFKFVPPPELLDTTPWIQQRFQSLDYDRVVETGNGGVNSSVTMGSSQRLASQLFREQGEYGMALRNEWENLDDEQKQEQHGGDSTKFVLSKGIGSVKARKIVPGRASATSTGGGGGGKGGVQPFMNTHFYSRARTTDQNGNITSWKPSSDMVPTQGPSSMTDEMLRNKTTGKIDLAGARYFNNDYSNHVMSYLQGGSVTGTTGRMITQPMMVEQIDENGNRVEVPVPGQKQFWAEVEINLSTAQLERFAQSKTKEGGEVFDVNSWEKNWSPWEALDEINDINTKGEWSQNTILDPDADNPENIGTVTQKVWVPVDINEANVRAADGELALKQKQSETYSANSNAVQLSDQDVIINPANGQPATVAQFRAAGLTENEIINLFYAQQK